MALSRRNFASSSRSLKWLIAICLALILVSAFVQAIHIDPAGAAGDVKHCPFCQLANAVTVAVVAILLLVVLTATTFLVEIPDSECKPVFSSANLFSRPPPAA